MKIILYAVLLLGLLAILIAFSGCTGTQPVKTTAAKITAVADVLAPPAIKTNVLFNRCTNCPPKPFGNVYNDWSSDGVGQAQWKICEEYVTNGFVGFAVQINMSQQGWYAVRTYNLQRTFDLQNWITVDSTNCCHSLFVLYDRTIDPSTNICAFYRVASQ